MKHFAEYRFRIMAVTLRFGREFCISHMLFIFPDHTLCAFYFSLFAGETLNRSFHGCHVAVSYLVGNNMFLEWFSRN